MKRSWFHTDCCNRVLRENEVHGILYKSNLFDKQLDYELCKPDKSNNHCCKNCYGKHVIQAAGFLMTAPEHTEEEKQAMQPFKYKFLYAVFNKIFYAKGLRR